MPSTETLPDQKPARTSPVVTPAKAADWPAIRQAFIRRAERPTYDGLAEEFLCPQHRIQRVAQDEGWSALRAAFFDERLRESDATVALLKAVKMDTAIMHEMSDVAVEVFALIRSVIADPQLAKKAASTRANVANTLSFALANLAQGCARVGIVGLPKSLKDAAQGSNGQWSAGMLASLNVTVQNIVSASAAPVPAVPETEVETVTEIPATPASLPAPDARPDVDLPAQPESDAVPVVGAVSIA